MVRVLADHVSDVAEGCQGVVEGRLHQKAAGFRWPDLCFLTTTTPLPWPRLYAHSLTVNQPIVAKKLQLSDDGFVLYVYLFLLIRKQSNSTGEHPSQVGRHGSRSLYYSSQEGKRIFNSASFKRFLPI